jgi:hypothetical protein
VAGDVADEVEGAGGDGFHGCVGLNWIGTTRSQVAANSGCST